MSSSKPNLTRLVSSVPMIDVNDMLSPVCFIVPI